MPAKAENDEVICVRMELKLIPVKLSRVIGVLYS